MVKNDIILTESVRDDSERGLMKKPGRKIDRKLAKTIANIVEEFGDVFHEWNTKKANSFFEKTGISKRNWRIYMRSTGQADGKAWTYRDIADDEGNISHVRAWQIVRQTEKNLKRYIKRINEQ